MPAGLHTLPSTPNSNPASPHQREGAYSVTAISASGAQNNIGVTPKFTGDSATTSASTASRR